MPKRSPFRIETDPSLKILAKLFQGRKSRGKLSKGTEKVARLIFEKLQKNTPRRSGRLIKSQKLTKSGDLTWEMSENVSPPYGRFISEGVPASKINPILPRKKQALWWPGLPHPVKAVYKHPGIKANPYVPRTIKESLPGVERIAEDIGDDIIISIL